MTPDDPCIIESEGKTYLIYNFTDINRGFNYLQNTKDLFLKTITEDKPIVVIDGSFEGEADRSWSHVVTFLTGWDSIWNELCLILSDY